MYLPRSRTKIVIVNEFLFAYPIIKGNERLVRFMCGPVGASFLKDIELREHDQKGGELSYPRSLINNHASCKPLGNLPTDFTPILFRISGQSPAALEQLNMQARNELHCGTCHWGCHVTFIAMVRDFTSSSKILLF
jgi:hypothetical protein